MSKIKFDYYSTENNHTNNHLWYLIGRNNDSDLCEVVATYSTKTNSLIIKNVNRHLPNSENLKEFINICNKNRR